MAIKGVITSTRVRAELSDLLGRVVHGGERIVVSKSGKKVAALISLEDLEMLESIEDYLDVIEAKEILATNNPEENVSLEEMGKRILERLEFENDPTEED
jgi:prevent-host-death family protein